MRRALSIETLRVFQASAQESDSSSKGLSMSVPGISKEASSNLASAVFESMQENSEVERIEPSIYLYYRFLILRILIGSAAVIAASSGGALLFLIGGVIVWSFHSARKKFENYWLLVTPDVCQIYDGWLRKKRSMFSFFKLQRVALYQNTLMRKRGVAHITFATAAGNRTFKFLNENDAKRLYDWSLMKIEQGSRNWM